MNLALERLYTGDGKRHYETGKDALSEPEPYVASPGLVEAVNMVLYLRRPLLLEGDPGCGKTRLAYAVAYELGYPLKECYVRSTSHAQDLLYSYDALGRLYDIQERRGQREPEPLQHYVTFGKLGEAIKLAQEGRPSVVLIDEIDKADIDFPNDLLLVLDRLQFTIDEVHHWKFDALQGKTRAEAHHHLPFFIITSNREKELPKAFLRRCLFYYIDFPQQHTLARIIDSHFQKNITPLFTAALKRFWQLHAQNVFRWRKKPGTSELLDWIRALEWLEQQQQITAEQLEALPFKDLPHLETLVKTQSDRQALEKLSNA